jgi:hypothetical protein
MNKIIRLTLKAVVAVVLISSATACNNIPLLGRNRAANQVENSPQTTGTQPVGQAPLGTSQPVTQGQNNAETIVQAPQTTVGQAGTGTGTGTVNTQPAPVVEDGSEPVPALW